MTETSTPLGPRTTELLERLRRVDLASGVVRRDLVERAVALHLAGLGLPARPPRWTDDGSSFMGELLSAGWTLHLRSSTGPEPLKVAHRSQLLSRLSKAVQKEARDPAYESALLGQTWSPVGCQHGLPQEETPTQAAGRAAMTVLENLPAFSKHMGPWAMAADAARGLLHSAGVAEGGPDFDHALLALTQIGATSGPTPSSLATQYVSALAQAEAQGVPPSLGALETMVDALVLGLWLFRPTAKETILVARPAMRFVGLNLHDEKGPAVSWAGGKSYWFLFGQAVDRAVVEAPATLDSAQIERESNPSRRGILIRQVGLDRYLRDAKGSLACESSAGRLFRFPSFALVEVRRLPSGFPAEYVRVPSMVKTPEEGLAWTFGLTVTERASDTGRPSGELYAYHDLGPVARGLIDRLRGVDRRNPAVDRPKAEAALAGRFPSIARKETKVSWLTGRAKELHGESFCEGHHLDSEDDQEPYAESMGEAAHSAHLVCEGDAESTALRELENISAQFTVSRKACEAVGVAAARHLGEITLSDDEFDRFWMSWVLLYEAGVGALWTSPGDLLVLPRPAFQASKK